MSKRVWPIILKAPLVILGIASFAASIYAAATGIQNITYWTSVVFAVIMILYFTGVFLDRKMSKKQRNN